MDTETTMDEQKLLEIEGTDPLYWDMSRLDEAGLARVVSRLDEDGLARVVSWLDEDGLARVVSWLDEAGLARVVSWLDEARLARVKKLSALLVPLSRPYSAVLKAIAGDGKLDMSTWHKCKTTHCLGGWIVTLAENGRELEKMTDTPTAAALILKKSRPDAPLPNFYASDKAAMAFIQARAKEEEPS